MTDDEEIKLQQEAAKGEQIERIWEAHIKPFFDAKHEELYETFRELPTTDKDGLVLIKLQTNVLAGMEDYFQTFIKTGQLARHTLKEHADD